MSDTFHVYNVLVTCSNFLSSVSLLFCLLSQLFTCGCLFRVFRAVTFVNLVYVELSKSLCSSNLVTFVRLGGGNEILARAVMRLYDETVTKV